MGGNSRVGPSPCSERPAPPHSLQTNTERDQRPASFTCQPVVLSHLFHMALPCHALFACLCHNPMPATLLFALPLCHHPQPCAPGSFSVLQRLPCRQPHHWDCIEQLVHRFLHPVQFHPVHFREEPGTSLGSRLPPCSCTKEPETTLGSLATSSNGLWDGIWHAVLG